MLVWNHLLLVGKSVLLDERSKTRQATSVRDAVVKIGIEADAQFLGGLIERHERIPSVDAIAGTGTEADISFAHPLANGQFSWIVVQGEIWMVKDDQQSDLFGKGLGDTTVQDFIASDSTKAFPK